MSFTFLQDEVLPEIMHVIPARYKDERGWFSETYNESEFLAAGIRTRFVQDNQSHSLKAGTLRGLHFQYPPYAQAKLVRCIEGEILDVAVDLRTGSPNFGKYTAHRLSGADGRQIYIPVGFAHGFCTLEDNCQIAYKVSSFFAPGSDGGVSFGDPDIAVEWPFPTSKLVLSEKDRGLPHLSELPPIFSVDVEPVLNAEL